MIDPITILNGGAFGAVWGDLTLSQGPADNRADHLVLVNINARLRGTTTDIVLNREGLLALRSWVDDAISKLPLEPTQVEESTP